MIYMVGDSVDADVRGALDARLGVILYSPMAQESHRLLFGENVPIISHMGQLLEHLGSLSLKIQVMFCLHPRPANYCIGRIRESTTI